MRFGGWRGGGGFITLTPCVPRYGECISNGIVGCACSSNRGTKDVGGTFIEQEISHRPFGANLLRTTDFHPAFSGVIAVALIGQGLNGGKREVITHNDFWE